MKKKLLFLISIGLIISFLVFFFYTHTTYILKKYDTHPWILENPSGTLLQGKLEKLFFSYKNNRLPLATQLEWKLESIDFSSFQIKWSCDCHECNQPFYITFQHPNKIIIQEINLTQPMTRISPSILFYKGLGGVVTFKSPQIKWENSLGQGEALISWKYASIPLLFFNPLGDYSLHINLEKNKLEFQISTESELSLLEIFGMGEGSLLPLHFELSATVFPRNETVNLIVRELLNLIGTIDANPPYKIFLSF